MVKEHGHQLTEKSILGNGSMERKMVKEHSITLMEVCMWVNSRIVKNMVKEHGLQLTERSILGNGRMERNMVREHSFILKKISF